MLDLEPPALVVCEMPLQPVELVKRHPVDHPGDRRRRLKMASAVEHETAPAKARRIIDVDGRDRPFGAAVINCQRLTAP